MAAPVSPIPLSRQISHITTASSDKDNIIFTTKWTEEQETRLLYCQTELKGAQRRWSESQELWIEEVCCTRKNPGMRLGSVEIGLMIPASTIL